MTDLPVAGEVVAALPLVDVAGGDVVHQVALLGELPATAPPPAGQHAGALGRVWRVGGGLDNPEGVGEGSPPRPPHSPPP